MALVHELFDTHSYTDILTIILKISQCMYPVRPRPIPTRPGPKRPVYTFQLTFWVTAVDEYMMHDVFVIKVGNVGDNVEVIICWKLKQHAHVGSLHGRDLGYWETDFVGKRV